jgi:hypothetical protein
VNRLSYEARLAAFALHEKTLGAPVNYGNYMVFRGPSSLRDWRESGYNVR